MRKKDIFEEEETVVDGVGGGSGKQSICNEIIIESDLEIRNMRVIILIKMVVLMLVVAFSIKSIILTDNKSSIEVQAVMINTKRRNFPVEQVVMVVVSTRIHQIYWFQILL